MVEFGPGSAALALQPRIERLHVGPALLGRLVPDADAPVAHVLLDDALLPAAGDVAELGLEQVVAGHGFKARVDRAFLAGANLVHGRLHVVVDAPLGHAAEGGKCPSMGIKQHLVALARIGNEPEGTAAAQLGMGHLQTPAQPAHPGVLGTPVELERVAQGELQRHESTLADLARLLGSPAPGKGRHPAVATGVALLDQTFVQGLDGAAIAFAAVQVGLEPGRQRFGIAVELGLVHPLGVLGLDHLALAQPSLDGVPCQARAPLDLFDWKAIAQVHPADLCQCSHVDHSLIPSCSKNKQETLLKGSKLGEKTHSRGVRFTWKSTG